MNSIILSDISKGHLAFQAIAERLMTTFKTPRTVQKETSFTFILKSSVD